MQCSVNCRPTSLNYYISRVSSYVSHVCSYTLLAFSLHSCSKQAICSVMILIFFFSEGLNGYLYLFRTVILFSTFEDRVDKQSAVKAYE